jgi:hypothetical protein
VIDLREPSEKAAAQQEVAVPIIIDRGYPVSASLPGGQR